MLLNQIHLIIILGVKRITLICHRPRACLLCERVLCSVATAWRQRENLKSGEQEQVSRGSHYLPYSIKDKRDRICSEPGLVPKAHMEQDESHSPPRPRPPPPNFSPSKAVRNPATQRGLGSSPTSGYLEAPGPFLKASCSPSSVKPSLTTSTFGMACSFDSYPYVNTIRGARFPVLICVLVCV